jgi:hypothetical protein
MEVKTESVNGWSMLWHGNVPWVRTAFKGMQGDRFKMERMQPLSISTIEPEVFQLTDKDGTTLTLSRKDLLELGVFALCMRMDVRSIPIAVNHTRRLEVTQYMDGPVVASAREDAEAIDALRPFFATIFGDAVIAAARKVHGTSVEELDEKGDFQLVPDKRGCITPGCDGFGPYEKCPGALASFREPVAGCVACQRAAGNVCWEHARCKDCRELGADSYCPTHVG